MRAARGLLLGLSLWAGGAWGQGTPAAMPRPEARAEVRPPAAEASMAAAASPAPRPERRPAARGGVPSGPPVALPPQPALAAVAPGRPRPRAPAAEAPAGPTAALPAPALPGSPLAVARAFAPAARPAGAAAEGVSARAEAARGQVCANPLVQGEVADGFGGGAGCGIEMPVRVRSVDGVRLSEPALMDCATASSLLTWVQEGGRPALGRRGGGLVGIDVMGHYACRPQNNQRGARLSEHGRGRAVDIGGFVLADGSRLSVLRDWPDPALRAMHRAACGPFTTVLGPEANARHRDHFHFDTARGRGPYCR